MDTNAQLDLDRLAATACMLKARLKEHGDAVERLKAGAESQRRARRRARLAKILPAACLALATGLSADLGAKMSPAPLLSLEAPPEPDALEAVRLAQDWRAAGDERSAYHRLGALAEHAPGLPAWKAEKVGADSYLVVFREPAGTPAYAFEVDLAAETVTPTPEAVEMLTLRRVRDEAQERLILLASAR